MAQFYISFNVRGVGGSGIFDELPVVALDNQNLVINDMEVKTFRFSVENTLDIDLSFDVSSTQNQGAPSGNCNRNWRSDLRALQHKLPEGVNTSGKIAISFDSNPLMLAAHETKTVTVTVTPLEPLLDTDLITVSVIGKQL